MSIHILLGASLLIAAALTIAIGFLLSKQRHYPNDRWGW